MQNKNMELKLPNKRKSELVFNWKILPKEEESNNVVVRYEVKLKTYGVM